MPHEINPLALVNKRVIYTILFRAVSQTLLDFGKDPKYGLGGKIGFIAILHTWDQKLLDHFHLHCLIPGGALSFDKTVWIPTQCSFLFNVKELSKTFREKFINLLEKIFKKGDLIFPGQTAYLATKERFCDLTKSLRQKKWVVFSKESFVKPEYVLDYLGRYTHRVAISNHRIKAIEKDTVSFSYKDRQDEGKIKTLPLKADEFTRRFLLHILPDDFMRIRYFGFLANRYKKENLPKCRKLLGLSSELTQPIKKTNQELMFEFTGLDIHL